MEQMLALAERELATPGMHAALPQWRATRAVTPFHAKLETGPRIPVPACAMACFAPCHLQPHICSCLMHA